MDDVLYLVDGYNVTRSDPATRRLGLESQREALVRRLGARGRGLLGVGRIVVVFDGAGHQGDSVSGGPVEVRYSRSGRSADDLIVALASREHGAVTIVTSDRGVAERSRVHAGAGAGAVTVWPRERLFEDAKPQRERRSGAGCLGGSTAGLPKGANKITQELKELWLDKQGGADAAADKE
jgi:predicted RNA-binding protein with PIN domain